MNQKTEKLIKTIQQALNIHIQASSVKVLVDDGNRKTIEIVSDDFKDIGDSFRADLVFTILNEQAPEVLVSFDITFTTLTKEEDLKYNNALPFSSVKG